MDWLTRAIIHVILPYNLLAMSLHHLTGFRSFSRKYGCISNRAERSLGTNLRVSTSLPTNFHAFSIPFSIIPFKILDLDGPMKMASSLLIQISSLKRNNSVFMSVIYNTLYPMSCPNNGVLPLILRNYTLTGLVRQSRGCPRSTHQT